MSPALARAREGIARWARAVFTLDTRSLALFRIGLGVLVVLDALYRVSDSEIFYSDFGVQPRSEIVKRFWRHPLPSVFLFDGSVTFVQAMFVVTMLCGVALALGWRTRIFTIASFVMILSAQNRFTYINTGADVVLLCSVIWACFLPLGARFSLDARAGRAPVVGDALCTWATAAIVVQLVFIYAFNFLNKMEHAWFDGSAVMRALHIDFHTTRFGVWFRTNLHALGPALTYATLALEAAPVLLLVSKRASHVRLALFVAVSALHVGFAACMNLGLFSHACVVLWLAVLPPLVWRRARAHEPVSPPAVPVWKKRLAHTVIAALLVTQLLVNLTTLWRGAMPSWLGALTSPLRWNQSWIMFRSPSRDDGWILVPATLASGAVVDLYHGGAEVTEEKPALVSAEFPGRWRKFTMNNTSSASNEHMRKRYLRYVCRVWNRTHDGDERALRATFTYMEERTRRDFKPPKIERRDLTVDVACPK
jgi:hypothetical protein